MNVVECDMPSGSLLGREVIEHAYFRDSYRTPLTRIELDIVDVFFGIFAHHPLWDEAAPDRSQQGRLPCRPGCTDRVRNLHVKVKDRYVVGDKIGVWPIFALSNNEIVAGRNNKHMDFRLSVLKGARRRQNERGRLHHLHGP